MKGRRDCSGLRETRPSIQQLYGEDMIHLGLSARMNELNAARSAFPARVTKSNHRRLAQPCRGDPCDRPKEGRRE